MREYKPLFCFGHVGLFFVLCLFFLFSACKQSPPKSISDEGLAAGEFLDIAATQHLPVTFTQKDLLNYKKDSTQVHVASFKTYLPDSVFTSIIGDKAMVKLRVLGKVHLNDQSTYLFIHVLTGNKKQIVVIYFDPQSKYLGHLVLLDSKKNKSGINYSSKVDAKFNISLIKEENIAGGELRTEEQIFYFDASGLPIMAVTNSSDDLSNVILGNPIDSLPRKHKYSGDYSTDKKNLVSIRDGRTDKSIYFFIHFSKRQGNCVGELKGEADWANKNLAVFRDTKSPCVLELRFDNRQVTIREINGCGSYRDIKCTYEGKYPKVKKMHYAK